MVDHNLHLKLDHHPFRIRNSLPDIPTKPAAPNTHPAVPATSDRLADSLPMVAQVRPALVKAQSETTDQPSSSVQAISVSAASLPQGSLRHVEPAPALRTKQRDPRRSVTASMAIPSYYETSHQSVYDPSRSRAPSSYATPAKRA